MKKRKILQLIYKLEVGGAEKIVCSLAEKFNGGPSQCDVLSFKGGMLEQELASKGIKVWVLHKRSGIDFSFIYRLYSIVRKNGYDILHSHTFSPNMWGRIIGRLCGLPVVVTTEHTIASHKKGWQKIIDRALCAAGDRIICVSNEVKRGLTTQAGIPDRKLEVIYNGVDGNPSKTLSSDERSALKTSLGLSGDFPLFVSVGRLSEPKGYRYLLEAIARITSSRPMGQFLIVGDGPLKDDLKHQSNALNLDNFVHFCGFRKDVAEILQLADIVVSSSVREGFPVSLLEAMRAGKPIVATRVGGNKEAIAAGKTGILVPPRDPVSLADAMCYMAGNPDFRADCGKAAEMEFYRRFTVDTMIEQTDALYKKILRAKHAD